MLKSHDTFPPGGWVFRQAETNWISQKGRTFDETVDDIIHHRKANPRFKLETDWNAVAIELDRYTETRLRSVPGAASYYTEGDPKPARPNNLSFNPSVGVVAGAKSPSIQDGLPLLIDWLGDGLNPVDQELATQRALICASCPRNRPGGWRHWFTGPVAHVIGITISLKHEMKLSTHQDHKLNVCDACLCELKLKVWTPMSHIKARLKDEQKLRLDPRCWILKEQ